MTATERIPFACLELLCCPDCSNPVRRIWAACTRIGTGRLSDPYPQGTRHCCTIRLLHNPFGHHRLGARFCLNIPYDCNGDRRIFIGQSQDKRFQIGNDCDRQDTSWPIGRCSSSEVLNQPLLPVFEFTCQIICLNGIFRRRLGRPLCRATPGRPATIRQQPPPAAASARRRGAMATARAHSPVCGPDRS